MKSYQSTLVSDLGLPPNSYIYSFATTAAQDDARTDTYQPLTSSDRLAVISTDDSLRVFDPVTLKVLPDGIFPSVNKSVTALKRFARHGQQCNILLTSGRDGWICGWDLRTRNQIYELRTPNNQPLAMIDANADLHAIVGGTELEGDGPGNVNIFGWDVRNPGTVKMDYSESHTDTITTLRFIPHAQSSSLLLSASTDGLINIFDTSIADEEDAVFQVINHRSALHYAGLIGNDIYGLGTDETLSLYSFPTPDLQAEEPPPVHLGDVRDTFGCEYVVNVAHSGNTPIIAAGNHSNQWLDLIPLRSNNAIPIQPGKYEPDVTNQVRLEGAHGEELVRDVFLADDAKVVFTCGEDGVVRQWRGNDMDDVDMAEVKSAKKRRHDGSGGKEKRSKSRHG